MVISKGASIKNQTDHNFSSTAGNLLPDDDTKEGSLKVLQLALRIIGNTRYYKI